MNISNNYGDVRKLLSTLEHAVASAEKEFAMKKESPVNNLEAKDDDDDLDELIVKNIISVSFPHVNAVIKSQALDIKQFYNSTPGSKKGTPRHIVSTVKCHNSTPTSLLKSKLVTKFESDCGSEISSMTSLSMTPKARNINYDNKKDLSMKALAGSIDRDGSFFKTENSSKKLQQVVTPIIRPLSKPILNSETDQSSSSESDDENDDTLPVHQALLLVALYRAAKKYQTKTDIEFDLLEQEYVKVCQDARVRQETISTVLDALESLEALTFVRVKKNSKNKKKTKIGLCVEESEIKNSFGDKKLIARLF